MSGTLYIVATPIGNLEDITYRAIRILKEVDIILAENTRKTSIITKKYDIHTRMMSYYQHSGEKKRLEILNMLVNGKNIALVTDAGTPGISDPGNELINYILSYDSKLKVIPIPGASALTSALSVSGFNVNKFVFLGFLPKKHKNKTFNWLKEGKISFAFYESPRRIIRTLETIEKVFGIHKRVFIARELTKIYETLYRGDIKEVLKILKSQPLKGEIVVIVE